MSAEKKPRIVIDARMVGPEGHGIALYVTQMAEGLQKLDLPYEPFYLIPSDCPRDSLLRTLPHSESAIPFLQKREILKLAKEIRQLNAALYHTTSFSSLLRYPCPYLQTVHDLNHLHYGNAAQKIYYRTFLLGSLKKAKAVVSVSKTAGLEIKGWLLSHGCDRELEFAPNAIETFPAADDNAVLHRFGLEAGNFFFALASAKPHKNLALLERAYSAALASRSLPPLVVSIPGQGPHGVVRTGPLASADLGALLRNCKAFYYPSVYEGFGRPPVEAALTGAVPVVSSISVHREVLEGVAETVYLDPAAVSLWKESFLRMANFSEKTSEKSRQWIRDTWSIERLAKAMDEIYRKCLGLHGS
ncbi:MAG TPA: glycosyltransferase [Bdellovibrionota bacterium]